MSSSTVAPLGGKADNAPSVRWVSATYSQQTELHAFALAGSLSVMSRYEPEKALVRLLLSVHARDSHCVENEMRHLAVSHDDVDDGNDSATCRDADELD